MERHVSHSALVCAFSGQASEPEVERAVAHLPGCRLCWDRTARVIAELKREGRLAPPFAAAQEIVRLFDREQAQARRWLLTRSRWEELKRLPARRQLDRIEADPELRTLEMFSALIGEAEAVSREDPHLGEETALVAYALAGALSTDIHPAPFRNDLQAEAMMSIVGCRRLAGNWRESAAALATARGHLLRGTGEPVREARLLSAQASLASETGHLEEALELLDRSAALHPTRDTEAVAVTVEQARVLLAACRYEEAIARAEDALSGLSPRDTNLEMLTRDIVTESLVLVGRPDEALHSFRATQPLHKQRWGRRMELQGAYLEALLLDARDHAREAEKAFRKNIADRMEAELYKDAFLTLVAFLRSLVRREAFDKAARVCEEALAMVEQAGSGCHSQMARLWRSLLALIETGRLTERQVLVARCYLARHWNVPARHAPLELPVPISGEALNVPRAEAPLPILPLPPKALSEPPETTGPASRYDEAWERYDRALIVAGLKRCGGRVREATRLLKISRNTVRDKMKKYGIEAWELSTAPDASPGPPPQDKEIEALDQMLRARALWGELKFLPRGQQLERLQTVSSLHTREMFEAMLDEASIVALNDPLQGEETALLAHTLVGLLPLRGNFPEAERNDLEGTALLAAANCRRLAGDWQGAAANLDAARSHFARGSGAPAREARFLSIQASVLADIRQIESALTLLARASALHRKAQEPAAVASVMLQAAGTLMSAGRHEDAISHAEVTLQSLPPGEARLELLARNVITESLVFLGRSDEALHSLFTTLPLYEEIRSSRTELQLGYLEALLLDALGYTREAETAFQNNIARRMDAELYKDAFLTAMTRLELLLGRGELDKAAGACEEALARIEETEVAGHATIRTLWRALLALVRERALTESHMLEARHYLVRWGAVAAHQSAPQAITLRLPAWVAGPDAPETTPAPELPVEAPPPAPTRGLLLTEPPDPAESLARLGYKGALEQYSRQLVAAGAASAKPAACSV